MTRDDIAAILDTVTAKAPGLRSAGVLSVTIADVVMQLSPTDHHTGAGDDEPAGSEPADPLNDPALYGRGFVPGYGPPTDDDG